MDSKRKQKTAPSTCETFFCEMGLNPVAGVDEAGRGPLAGPVVACALILPPDCSIEGVTDSKKLSPTRREALAKEIIAKAVDYNYGMVDAAQIDKINIHKAVLFAMAQAIEGLKHQPRVVLIDGKFSPALCIPSLCIIKGDTHSHLIAAASILAKQTRDRIMCDLHHTYPQYGFDKHKGYGTKAHIEALRQYGPSPVHRLSYKYR